MISLLFMGLYTIASSNLAAIQAASQISTTTIQRYLEIFS
jgi:hypothetical protein